MKNLKRVISRFAAVGLSVFMIMVTMVPIGQVNAYNYSWGTTDSGAQVFSTSYTVTGQLKKKNTAYPVYINWQNGSVSQLRVQIWANANANTSTGTNATEYPAGTRVNYYPLYYKDANYSISNGVGAGIYCYMKMATASGSGTAFGTYDFN